MTTVLPNNNNYVTANNGPTVLAPNSTTFNKPRVDSPGARTVTHTTTTTQPVGGHAGRSKGFGIFETIMSVLTALGYLLGAVLLIAAMGTALDDRFDNNTAVGVLLIIGFGLWFITDFIRLAPTFGVCTKRTATRRGYLGWSLASAITQIFADALLVIGACLYLTDEIDELRAGRIVWIVGSSLWLIAMLLRDMGVRWDGMNTYKNRGVLPTTVSTTTTANNNTAVTQTNATTDAHPHYKTPHSHLSSYWANSLANDLYVIAGTLLVLGSIMFLVDFDYLTSLGAYFFPIFQAAAIMWLVAGAFIVVAAIAQLISRRV